jgi:hypothetical protein
MSKVIITEIDLTDFIVSGKREEDFSSSITVSMDEGEGQYYKGIIGSNYFWTIINDNGNSPRYLIFFEKKAIITLDKESFLDKIAKVRQEDFSWFLFHPEIFEGKYHKDGSEDS